jgi:hypothetical protein
VAFPREDDRATIAATTVYSHIHMKYGFINREVASISVARDGAWKTRSGRLVE